MICPDCGTEAVLKENETAIFTRGNAVVHGHMTAYVCGCGSWFSREALQRGVELLAMMGGEAGPVTVTTFLGAKTFTPDQLP